jgi:acyl-CoA thioester hydrolase
MTSRSAGVRADYRVFRSIPTRWMDNDSYGHVNNVVHYSLFDTAVNAHLVEAGLLDIAGGATIGLVVETGCRFFRSISFPEVVEAGLRVAHMGRSSVRYEIGLFTAASPDAAAEGFLVHVYVDRDHRRPVPLAAAWRDALARIAAG